jgi:superfamily II DNA helicase RecQ
MFAPQDWTEALATAEETLKLPYKMRPFQEDTARALFHGQDVILVSYTGSGKTVISPVTCLTKRSRPSKEKGVVLHLLPLNELILEKTAKSELRAGSILMGGEAKMQSGDAEPGEEKRECDVSFSLEDIERGDIKIIFAHPESLSSAKGSKFLTYLLRNQLLLGVICDEFHKFLHWSVSEEEEAEGKPKKRKTDNPIREGMLDMLQEIRARAPGVPFLLETATLMKRELELTKQLLKMEKAVVICSSPVLDQHFFCTVKRPDQSYGFWGKANKQGVKKDGLIDFVRPLIIEPMKKIMAMPEEERKVMMVFCRDKDTLISIDEVLCDELPEYGHLTVDSSPWVTMFANRGCQSERFIRKRTDIWCYLTTTVLEVGKHIPDVHWVVNIKPLCRLHDLLQAFGRSGRECCDGLKKAVCFTLWEGHDVGQGMKGMTDPVRDYVRTKGCLKECFDKYFALGPVKQRGESDWCCSNCYSCDL